MNRLIRFGWVIAVFVLAGCRSDVEMTTVPMVTGTVSYREVVTLPDNAVLTVSLLDVSIADKAAKVLSTVTYPLHDKQPPFLFSLPYTAEQVNAAQSISLSARITAQDRLLYTTTTFNEVLTNGESAQLSLALERVNNW